LTRLTWLAIVAVALVLATFGYAATGDCADVVLGVGCGLATAFYVRVRGSSRSGAWIGIPIGSIVGITVPLIGVQGVNWAFTVMPLVPLALGLMNGLGWSCLCDYRDVTKETFKWSIVMTAGLIIGLAMGDSGWAALVAAYPLLSTPWVALIVGFLSHCREEWRDTRPPWWLILGAAAVPLLLYGVHLNEPQRLLLLITLPVALPMAAFHVGRATAELLKPRLRQYDRVVKYLRVMWIPIGGFAIGYLTIIVVFAGLYGTLDRLCQNAFSGGGATEITDWLAFAFFTALGHEFTTIAPDTGWAKVLVGVHLILSAGWALVVFAAVMASIGPELARIGRGHTKEGDDGTPVADRRSQGHG